MINIHKTILCAAIAFLAFSTANSYADNKTTGQSTSASSVKDIAKSNTTIPLKTIEKYLDRSLKNKVLVGAEYADKQISVNLKKVPLNYSQLLTQLHINGFTAYRSDDYIQIINFIDARQYPIPIVEKNKTYFRDEFVTDFLKTEKACTMKALRTLSPLVPRFSLFTAYANAHTIIIMDTYGNVQRAKAMLKQIEDGLSEPESCESVLQK